MLLSQATSTATPRDSPFFSRTMRNFPAKNRTFKGRNFSAKLTQPLRPRCEDNDEIRSFLQVSVHPMPMRWWRRRCSDDDADAWWCWKQRSSCSGRRTKLTLFGGRNTRFQVFLLSLTIGGRKWRSLDLKQVLLSSATTLMTPMLDDAADSSRWAAFHKLSLTLLSSASLSSSACFLLSWKRLAAFLFWRWRTPQLKNCRAFHFNQRPKNCLWWRRFSMSATSWWRRVTFDHFLTP